MTILMMIAMMRMTNDDAGDEKDGDHHVGWRSWQVWCVDGLASGASHPQADRFAEKIANQFFGHILKPVAMFFNLYYNVNI